MHVPRRHYRRLLLPPGWVVLGFLLLLGCQVLLMNRERLLPTRVLQLTMPILKKLVAQKRQEDNFSVYLFSNPLASIKTATHWQDAALTGKPFSDSVNEATIKAMILAI